MRPGLCDIKDIHRVRLRNLRFHNLYIKGPDRIVAIFNGIEQICSVIIGICTRILGSVLGAHILNASNRLEMELAVFEAPIYRNELIGVDTKAIDVSERSGDSP